jgi:PAS domain S-box-containing protein
VQDITQQKQVEERIRFQAQLLDAVEQAVVVTDPGGRVVYWNPFAEQLYGWTAEEAIGRTTIDLIATEESQEYAAEIMACLQNGESWSGEYLARHRDGTSFPIEVTCTPVSNAQGELTHIIGISMDITERKQVEEAVAEERNRLDTILSTLDTGLSLINPDMTIAWVNRKIHQMFSGETPIGQRCHVYYESRDTPCEKCGTLIAFQTGETQVRERQNEGDERWYRIISQPVKDRSGNVIRVLEGVTDITERKQAEQALRESEERYRVLFQSIQAGVVVHRADSRIVMCNVKAQELLGLTEDQMLGNETADPIWRFLREDGTPMPRDEYPVSQVLNTGQPLRNFVIGIVLPCENDVVWAMVNADPTFDAAGNIDEVIVSFMDITERKRAGETLRQYAERLRIQHEIDAAILAAQSPEEIGRAALMRLRDLIPYQRASIAEIDLPNQKVRTIVVLDEEREEKPDDAWHPLSVVERTMDELRAGRVYLLPDMAALEDPSPLERTLVAAGARAAVSVPLMIRDTVIGSLNLASDAPDSFRPDHVEVLQEIADSLAVALRQAHLLEQAQEDAETKALLLREVNHRVLNNLTMILGILDMERIRPLESEDDFHAALDDVTRRVDGMVTVHRMLSSAQWAPLDLREVAVKVIQAALKGLPDRQTVEFTVEASGPPHRVTPRQGIEVAVALNELTTNSVKYAFDERSAGRITVRIVTADEGDEERKVEVVFRDNGPGFPEAVLDGEREGIGLWLAASKATRDLGGEIELWNDDGAVVSLTFTAAAGSDRPVVDDDR